MKPKKVFGVSRKKPGKHFVSTTNHKIKFCLPREYFIIVPLSYYQAGWQQAKSGDKSFRIKNRKLYWCGMRVYKQKPFVV